MNTATILFGMLVLLIVAFNAAIGALIAHATSRNAPMGALVGIIAGPVGWLILYLDRGNPANKGQPEIAYRNPRPQYQ